MKKAGFRFGLAFVSAVATIGVAAKAQPTTTTLELQEAKLGWLQCVQSFRDQHGRPPSSGFFGPRFEVNSTVETCRMYVEKTRAALIAAENAAGRPASKKDIGRAMDEAKHSIAASLVEPNPSRRVESRPTYPASSQLATVVAVSTCSGSDKRGLEAYNIGDFETAYCHWWPKALKGDAAAQNNIGVLFEHGGASSAPQSVQAAAAWYLASAKKGFVVAMRNLAHVQESLGYNAEAASWLQMAVNTEAQQAQNRQQTQEGLNSLGYALGCALAGGCSPAISKTPVQNQQALPALQRQSAAPVIVLCPNGTYVSGSNCRLAPNGTYVGGTPTLAPDGSYVGGRPRIVPNGKYVGGYGKTTVCPDGSFVTGTRCLPTPAGTYVGVE